jgi:TonB family protein
MGKRLTWLSLLMHLFSFQASADLRLNIKKVVSIPYPRLPALAGIKGEVIVKFTISPDGGANIVNVKGENNLLEQAAQQCLSLWRFEKPTREETAEKVSHTLIFRFNLKGICMNTSCPTRFEFEFPNLAIIETSSPHWQPEVVPKSGGDPK